jgi:O-antigen/teichoic acid export membrane protein
VTTLAPGMSRDLSRKAAWSIASQVVGLLAGLAVVIVAARTVGPTGLGEWRFAQAIVAYVIVLGDLGLSTYAAREIARRPDSSPALVMPVLLVRTFASAGLGIAALLAMVWAPTSPSQLAVTAVATAAAVLTAASPTFLLQGQERIATTAHIRIVTQAVSASLAVGLAVVTGQILPVAVAYAVGALVGTSWTLRLARRGRAMRHRIDWIAPSSLLRSGLPFLGTALAIQVLTNGDSFLLGIMKGPEALGLYAAPYAVASYMMLVGGAIMTATFPRIARLAGSASSDLPVLLGDLASVNGSIGIPAALAGIMLSSALMPALFGEAFAAEGPVFALLMAFPLFGYFNLTVGQFLAAADRERPAFRVAAVSAILNIGLNLVLIPPLGGLGCAISVAITEVASVVLYLLITPASLRRKALGGYVSIVPATVCMALALGAGTILGWPWFASAAFAGGVLVVATLVMKPQAYRVLSAITKPS